MQLVSPGDKGGLVMASNAYLLRVGCSTNPIKGDAIVRLPRHVLKVRAQVIDHRGRDHRAKWPKEHGEVLDELNLRKR